MRVKGRGTVELAEAAGVNKVTISLWRGGRQSSYEFEKVERVAKELETTAEELLDLPVAPLPPSGATPAREHEPTASQRELLKRIAELGPAIDSLAELQEVVDEARRLSS